MRGGYCGAVIRSVVLAASGVALLTACESQVERPRAAAVQHPMIEGVPLPSGFRLRDERSVGSSSGPVRVFQYEFLGELDRVRAGQFFKEYMPTGGWALRQESFDRGVHDLVFESDTEQCLIRLRPEGRKKLAIVVNVKPGRDGRPQSPQLTGQPAAGAMRSDTP